MAVGGAPRAIEPQSLPAGPSPQADAESYRDILDVLEEAVFVRDATTGCTTPCPTIAAVYGTAVEHGGAVTVSSEVAGPVWFSSWTTSPWSEQRALAAVLARVSRRSPAKAP